MRAHLFRLTLIGAVLASLLPGQAEEATQADVVVYGSTPGGFCAAIGAAREGASVILLEPTQHVGGMNTGGLSFSDSNQMCRGTLMGLFHEWHLRIQQDYESRGIELPYDVRVKDQSEWSYEPHVASRVTLAMLDEAGVRLLTGRYLQSVEKSGPRITRLVTKQGSFKARVFIDGSYEGDLMAAAGVSWRIGREGRGEFGETLAGKQYTKRVMEIDGFDANGQPLPLITHTGDGEPEAGDQTIMTYSFRLSLTKEPANRVEIPQPANYDPARFEVIRRYVRALVEKMGEKRGQKTAEKAVRFDSYKVPNKKYDGNNAIGAQFSLGLVGGNAGWAEADEAGRAAIFEAHKEYTLEFLHFLRTDPVFSAQSRKAQQKWGLCKDEFVDSGHFPPQLYVRESRRLEGLHMISEKDILKEPTKPDAIAISSFPIDSHDCRRIARKDGTVVNEGTIFPVIQKKDVRQGYPYHVPYRSILPKPAECDNLLVPVALSSTHVAMSSLRIEGAWMVIGQSSGIAAALAARSGIAVQDLSYDKLKPRLLAQKQVLELPDDVVPWTPGK
ncbi:FAD-dependent oxidoreductase [Haloferula sp. A504]|uniref:FAD-dependent oxidoreductase n=1 Tax=Haloferula sp. A504 TaxID=3373601 RepID=UPI0031BEF1C5|nr:FAD-dependent oxidoreductase [Verrucomicrobiaceae bacterium E54]